MNLSAVLGRHLGDVREWWIDEAEAISTVLVLIKFSDFSAFFLFTYRLYPHVPRPIHLNIPDQRCVLECQYLPRYTMESRYLTWYNVRIPRGTATEQIPCPEIHLEIARGRHPVQKQMLGPLRLPGMQQCDLRQTVYI